MRTINGDILDVKCGVICQQVNCAGGYGAGLSGKISRKYPKVERTYRKFVAGKEKDDLLGVCLPVPVAEDLIVVNIFAERNYANAYETGIVSTDMNVLVDALHEICERYPDKDIYVPYRIGCGLAGGNWNELCERCRNLPITVVRLPYAK